MQSEKGKLIIHTGFVPEGAFQEKKSVRWRSVRHPLSRRRFGLAPKKAAPSILGMEEKSAPAKENGAARSRSQEDAREAFDRAKEALAQAGSRENKPAREKALREAGNRPQDRREASRRARHGKKLSLRGSPNRGAPRRVRAKLSFSERLLRNSAVACALMLGILAVRNLDVPWARAAVGGIEHALTMRIDLDESLGKLSFVRALMPESVLVFFDLSDQNAYARPVEGTLTQLYSQGRPWLEFECAEGSDVRAAEAGEVLMVTQLSDGDWGVMIDHGEGRETVYAYLSQPEVEAGQKVERGQKLGSTAGETAYFEARSGGEPCDPSELLGL